MDDAPVFNHASTVGLNAIITRKLPKIGFLTTEGHRDILDVGDAVDAYMAAWKNIDRIAGRAFNLGGGPTNAISLRQLVAHIGETIGREPDLRFDDWRAGDQRYYVSDTRMAIRDLGLRPPTPWRKGVAALARWLQEERGLSRAEQMPLLRTADALS